MTPDNPMTAERIEALFTQTDQGFHCARWGRPVAPVIFGLADETLDIFRSAIKAGFTHAGHPVVETDPEMGANLMVFFLRSWDELSDIPDLAHLTGIPDLPQRLKGSQASQYRLFRHDGDDSIRACMIFLNMSGPLAEAHPAKLAERVMMQSALTFATDFVADAQMAALIRAAYDPVLPVASDQPTHALRLAARMTAQA
ncbi:hypothetical protein [Paracoccus indicus]|uniref:hypothetical protein n=1 Tax=Paracoccus indicus TaxID=2079229 RepID=UPI001FE2B770|nr:hypothetical protein [Paracoccus indicus]